MKVVVEYWVGSVVATREHLNAQVLVKGDGDLTISPGRPITSLLNAMVDDGGPYGGYAKGVWRYYHYELERASPDAPASGS